MNRYFVVTFGFLPVFVIAGVVVLFLFGRGSEEKRPSTAEGLDKELKLYAEVRQKLLDHYDGELEPEVLLHSALEGMPDGTGDRFTRVNPPLKAREQKQGLEGGFYGIGVITHYNDDGSIRVDTVLPDGGAMIAGVRANDVIVAVDGVSILGQPYEDSVQRIKSDRENSKVTLTVLRGGKPDNGSDPVAQRLDLEVTRSRVVDYSVHDAHIEEKHGRRFGFVRIEDFNTNTFDPQFKDAVAELAASGAEGLVLDLRMNGGGVVSAAVDLVDSFLSAKDALIVFTHSSRESNRPNDYVIRTSDDTAITALPLVILVDDQTASASEIVTGALRDHGRAYVIGTRTYGKGLVQTIFELDTDPGYSMNITTTQYFTPLGRRVQKGKEGEPGGILPDLIVEYRHGEKEAIRARQLAREARFRRDELARENKYWNYDDRMLQAALDVLAGKPVTVQK